VISNTASKIHNGELIQDFSYVVKANVPLSSYKPVYEKTVHPAGFSMYGEYSMGSFTMGSPVSIPHAFGVPLTGSALSNALSIKTGFDNLNYLHRKSFQFYDAMKTHWFTTPATVFSGYTFENYTLTSPNYIASTYPLTNLEPYVSNQWQMSATVVTDSNSALVADSTGINIGYRVIGYDANGNSIFRDNHLLLEDTFNLLAEDNSFLSTEDSDAYVLSVPDSTHVVCTKHFNATGSETIVVQNIPSLFLS
jgi:hypothetical protein